MNKEVNLDIKVFKDLYNSFKDFLVPVSIIFACILIFFIIIFPQIKSFLDNKQLESAESDKIKIMTSNISTLSSLNDDVLNTQVLKVTKTLPPEKDFAGIIKALSDSASTARVSIGDFQIQVGDLTQVNTSSNGVIPSIQITINVQGDVNELSSFLNALSENNPVSTIDSVKSGSGYSTIKISFYYRPLPQIKFNNTVSILPLDAKQQEMISKLPEPEVTLPVIPASTASGFRDSPF